MSTQNNNIRYLNVSPMDELQQSVINPYLRIVFTLSGNNIL